MRKLSKIAFFGALTALPLLMGAQTASANILALVIDASGSIVDADYTLQKNGYVAALNTLYTSNPGYYGQNSIAIWQFANGVYPVLGVTAINNSTDLGVVTGALSAMSRAAVDTGATAIGDAVTAAAALIGPLGGVRLIDVSTDGANNTGSNPMTAVANAILAGISKVNCLGVGAGANCGFIGANGTPYAAASFAEFEAAISSKLAAELNNVPEPGTIALFGFSLLGLAGMRRRRKSA